MVVWHAEQREAARLVLLLHTVPSALTGDGAFCEGLLMAADDALADAETGGDQLSVVIEGEELPLATVAQAVHDKIFNRASTDHA